MASGKTILILERGDQLPREAENWSSKAVFVERRYQTKEHWYDKRGKPFTPNTHYWVGGNTTFYGAALMRLRGRDFEEVEHAGGVSPAWPISLTDMAPYYTEAETLWRVHGNRGDDPTEEGNEPAYDCAAVHDDPGIAQLREHWKQQGWRPFSLPLGIKLDQAHPVTSACIKCKTCGGYPCLLKAKSDARTIAIEPLMDLPNVFAHRAQGDAAGDRSRAASRRHPRWCCQTEQERGALRPATSWCWPPAQRPIPPRCCWRAPTRRIRTAWRTDRTRSGATTCSTRSRPWSA